MSIFSDEMAVVARELIVEFGETATFNRTVQAAYDPTSADTYGQTDTAFFGSIVQTQYKNSDIDGTLVQRGDFLVLAHKITTGEIPLVGDVLTFSDISCRILDVRQTMVNGVGVLYAMQCRV